jgi:hypothetical protein
MNWQEKVKNKLNEEVPKGDPREVLDNRASGIAKFFGTEKKGYRGLATRLTKDLGKNVGPKAVKNALRKLEKTKEIRKIYAMSQSGKIRDPRAFRFSLIYKLLLDYFR